uniref:NAD(P)H-quinone oxidoreductase subunit M, chloroplastic n=1 Tax=Zea mays TaxID=4577 RepID=A0A804RPZ1_MAIZE
MATTAFLSPPKLSLPGRRFASARTAGRVRVPPARAQEQQQQVVVVVEEEEAEVASVPPPPQSAEEQAQARKGDAAAAGGEQEHEPRACQLVFNDFQDLVDHYEGAELSEYTLRLIGSDLEHYIRKLLYDRVIKYNMRSRVLIFSMGKPRIKFNSSQVPDATK